ncbi:histidyl-tRNA synthetase [Raphidocelis subcapitata]|uniref:Histidyl-tRNA synthetase n=1 Tax=Raphidocelis subcapitata TaxID=307507 RepID=A0A2V0PE08_9CHLO|nr:histidyl-tRNA synthetase [Raphidocelis subcapitata]|eukprot:GBF98091.1 histidyl-tRNA synthetase [Raphidocelis subcapitata]
MLLLAVALSVAFPRRALAGNAPTYCSKTGTPLQAPVVGGGSFGFSVSTNVNADTVIVGQPDANGGKGLVYAYNHISLCAYQSFELQRPPDPTSKAGGAEPAGLLGMMTAMSRDGKWLAVAGSLEASSAMAQVFIYRRHANDSNGGFELHQKLLLQPGPTANLDTPPGHVYAGSLSMSRDGRLVLVSWSVYGAGQGSDSSDPYGPPSGAFYGSAQLYRRLNTGDKYTRAQADLARIAPPLTRTQFFGANSAVVGDGSVIAVSTRVIDPTQPAGAPAIVIYRRTNTGVFELLTTLRVPGSDGTFVMTDTGSHLAVVRGTNINVYVREGDLSSGKTVYNKRCTLVGEEMNLEPTFTKLAMTISNNSTLRLAVGNSLDSVFVWSIPLGGKRAYNDGTCPSSLERTLTGETGSQFGTALAVTEDGRTLIIGVPGSSQHPDVEVLMVDIEPQKAPSPAPAPGAPPKGMGGLFRNPKASSVNLDNTYFVSNPSSVLVSARRGTVGVPAPQPFDLNSWSKGSPGGAPYDSQLGYSIAPNNPYVSGGRPVKASSTLGLLSAMGGLGLSTASLRPASLQAG